MSGQIRQAIGLTKRRLNNALTAYNQIKEQLETNLENIETEQLYELFETVNETFEKLRKYTSRLQNLDHQWVQLIEKMDEINRQAEIVIRDNYLENYGNYLPLIKEGEEAVDHVRRRILKFKRAVSDRLQIDDNEEEPNSENTLKTLPQNDAVFPLMNRSETPTTFQTTNPETRPETPEPKVVNQTSNSMADLLFLPKVTIPEFNGNPSRWQEFWDLFTAMVDKRNLENCIKLFHLKSHLKGEAALSIANVGNANDDYDIAKKTLLELYGDQQRVAHRLRSEILHYKTNEGAGSVALYKDWAKLNQLYAQLVALGDSTDTTLMAQVIETKWPRYILQKVINKNKKEDIKTGSQMLKAIGEELKKDANLDRIVADNKGFFLKRMENKNQFPIKDRKKLPFHQTHSVTDNKIKPLECQLCGGEHYTYGCKRFDSPQDRIKAARNKQLCFNCLWPGHRADKCERPMTCRNCNKKHHFSLCFQNGTGESSKSRTNEPKKGVKFQGISTNKSNYKPKDHLQKSNANKGPRNKSVTNNAIINDDDLLDEKLSENNEEENTHYVEEINNQGTVLLMTVRAKITNPKDPEKTTSATVFLDTGSSKSYISNELAEEIGIKPLRHEKINLSTFGAQKITSNRVPIYSIQIEHLSQKLKTEKTLKLETIGVPALTSPMKAAIIPNGRKLFTKKVKPLVLIGMDYFDAVFGEFEKKKLMSGFYYRQTNIGPVIFGNGHTFEETYHVQEVSSYPIIDESDSETILEKAKMIGYLKIISGPMFSGKTTSLIEHAKTYIEENRRVLVIKSKMDKRYSENFIVTHNKDSLEAVTTEKLNCEAIYELALKAEVILIDEFHFFEDIEAFCEYMTLNGKLIIIAGLNSGENWKSLPNTGNLWALANEIKLLTAICKSCGNLATHSKRITPLSKNESPVGGAEAYSPLCRQCYSEQTDKDQLSNDPIQHTLCITSMEELGYDKHQKTTNSYKFKRQDFSKINRETIHTCLAVVDQNTVSKEKESYVAQSNNLQQDTHNQSHYNTSYNPCPTYLSEINGEIYSEHNFAVKELEMINRMDEEGEETRIQLQKFWELEHLGILDDAHISDDELAMRSFNNAISRDADGMYECGWPYRVSQVRLPSNYSKCIFRLKSTLKRLEEDPKLFQQYEAIFKEQLEKSIIEEAPEKPDGPIHYFAHFPVITPQKTTTKVRIVLDASMKTSSGQSLNDILIRGPVMLPNLFGMILRFRAANIPLISDLEKAFLHVRLRRQDRDPLLVGSRSKRTSKW